MLGGLFLLKQKQSYDKVLSLILMGVYPSATLGMTTLQVSHSWVFSSACLPVGRLVEQ